MDTGGHAGCVYREGACYSVDGGDGGLGDDVGGYGELESW